MVMSKISSDSGEIYNVGQTVVNTWNRVYSFFHYMFLNTNILRPFELTRNSVDWEAEHLFEVPIQPLAGY